MQVFNDLYIDKAHTALKMSEIYIRIFSQLLSPNTKGLNLKVFLERSFVFNSELNGAKRLFIQRCIMGRTQNNMIDYHVNQNQLSPLVVYIFLICFFNNLLQLVSTNRYSVH